MVQWAIQSQCYRSCSIQDKMCDYLLQCCRSWMREYPRDLLAVLEAVKAEYWHFFAILTLLHVEPWRCDLALCSAWQKDLCLAHYYCMGWDYPHGFEKSQKSRNRMDLITSKLPIVKLKCHREAPAGVDKGGYELTREVMADKPESLSLFTHQDQAICNS